MRRIETSLESVNGGANYAILVEKAPIYQWQDGKRVSDTPIGVRLTLALHKARLTQLSVKYDHDPLPKVTDEQIEEAISSCNFLYVQIPDCVVTLYNTSNGIGMSASAGEAKLVAISSK